MSAAELDDPPVRLLERVRRKVPVLCDLKPSGQYVMTDLHAVGGVPQVMKMLLKLKVRASKENQWDRLEKWLALVSIQAKT